MKNIRTLFPALPLAFLSACATACASSAPAPATTGATTPAATTPAAATAPPPAPPSATAPPRVTVEIAPARGDLQTLLRAEVSRARALGLAPFAEFYAPWCKPCQHIDQYRDDPRMVDAFRGTYVIRLDLDQWREHLDRAVYPVASIPVFYPLDAEGRPTGPTLTSEAWGPSVPEEMAPKLKAFFGAAGARSSP